MVLLLSALALTLPGCRRDASTAQMSDCSGTYALASINGNKLPCTPPHEGGAPQVQSGSITLEAGGNFTSAMAYLLPGGRAARRDFSGSYTRDGSRFTLRWKGAGTTTAILEGNTFTMDNEGVSFAYKK